MNLKTRIERLESVRPEPTAEDENLSAQERYLRMLDKPIPKQRTSTSDPTLTLTPEEAYQRMMGKI